MENLGSPTVLLFIIIILTAVVVMGLSRMLDHIWARVLRSSWLYFVFSAPGVIVHECSHVIGCLVTGAKVKKVVLISKDGGMVSYTRPVIPLVGNVIISTAPLFFLPLVLAALTWFFGTYAGCTFSSAIPVLDSPASMYSLVIAIGQTLYLNLVAAFNPWFLIYLYLVMSLALSFSPSTQDLKNALVGILILVLAGFCLIVAGIPYVTDLFIRVVNLFGTGLAIAFAFELIALLVSLPALIFYRKVP